MGDLDDFDLDRTTARAWSRFQADLGDHVAAMQDDDVLVVDVQSGLDDDAEGAPPYVQFCAWGENLVRAEVSSNEYLAEEVLLDDAAESALAGLGWNAPTHAADDEPDSGSANFYLDAERREADRVAAMAVAALREVFGVPHPAFLGWPPRTDEAVAPAEVHPEDRWAEEPLAVLPESADHLRELVLDALTPPGMTRLEVDEDGDIPLPTGSALLFVRVERSAPVVQLFSYVVRGVEHRDRAAFEVAVLNRDTRMIKFVLLDDAVLAMLHLPAAPFAPRQLRPLVGSMADIIDRIDDDLVARVGGRRGLEPEPDDEVAADGGPDDDEDDEGPDDEDAADEGAVDEDDGPPARKSLHPALLTLLHLDPGADGGIDPELAASVCDFDRDLVLTLLRESSEQEIEWRKSGDLALLADNSEEAQVCFGEARSWQATVETLRVALRVIVERQRAESTTGQSRARPDAGGGPRSRRRHRTARQVNLSDEAGFRSDREGRDTLFDPDV